MNEQNNDQWLDDLISETINTEKPVFNVEKWKQKYPDEFQALQSRANKAPAHSVRRTKLLKNPIVKFAAAAVVIMVIGLFLGRNERAQDMTKTGHREAPPSETTLISMMSLRLSYQQGGFEALDEQFRKTVDVLGPRPSRISMRDLLEATNGS